MTDAQRDEQDDDPAADEAYFDAQRERRSRESQERGEAGRSLMAELVTEQGMRADVEGRLRSEIREAQAAGDWKLSAVLKTELQLHARNQPRSAARPAAAIAPAAPQRRQWQPIDPASPHA